MNEVHLTFDGDNVNPTSAVDEIDKGRQDRAFAARTRSSHQNQTL